MARLGPLLDRCLPGDAAMLVTVSLELCDPLAGRPCAPAQLAWMFLLQGIKWPPVVGHAPAALRETLGIASSDAIASSAAFLGMRAPQFVDCLVRLLEFASDGIASWGPMMTIMNSGTMWSKSGLVHLCKGMGLLSPWRDGVDLSRDGNARPLRRVRQKKADPEAEDGEAGRRMVLSHTGTQYTLHEDTASRTLAEAMIQGVVDEAATSALAWPASVAEVPTFLDTAKAFAQAVRSRKWPELASREDAGYPPLQTMTTICAGSRNPDDSVEGNS